MHVRLAFVKMHVPSYHVFVPDALGEQVRDGLEELALAALEEVVFRERHDY